MTKEMYTFLGLWIGSTVLITIINVILFSDVYLTMKFFTFTMFMTLLWSGLALELLETDFMETIIFSVSFISIPIVSIVYYYDYQLPEDFPSGIFTLSFFLAILITSMSSKIGLKTTPKIKEKTSLRTAVIDLNPFINEDYEHQLKTSYHRNYPTNPNQPVNIVIEPNPFINEDQPKKALNARNKIKYYNKYHPWYGGNNNSFNHFSGKILDLKKGKFGAVDYFFKLLKGHFDSNIDVIVIVPSHDPANLHSSVRQLAKKLASYHHWYDGTGIVKRTKKINKLAQGGNRDKSVHFDSLTISNHSLLKNKNVLVFDDITTSGNSLYATMQLLRESGVNSVYGYAIGYTE